MANIPPPELGLTDQQRGEIYVDGLFNDETRKQRNAGNIEYGGQIKTDPVFLESERDRLIADDVAARNTELSTYDADAAAKKARMEANVAFAESVAASFTQTEVVKTTTTGLKQQDRE